MRTTTAIQVFSLGLALSWIGCDAIAPTAEEEETRTEHLENTSRTLTSVKKEPARVPDAIAIEPANGAFTDRRTNGLSVRFTGFTEAGGQAVEIQILRSADAPIAETSWVTIGSGTSSTTPTTFNDPDPIFRYEVQAVPTAGGEWRQGGVARFRAVAIADGGERTLLPFYDTSAGDCVAAVGAKSWKTILKTCKSPFSPEPGAKLGSTQKAATLVSVVTKPGDEFIPNYLSRKGYGDVDETIAYYEGIDAPRTLDEYEERYGFFDNEDITTVYYNLGDLGIGREMHCTTFATDGGGTACYVRNFGVDGDGQPDFSGDPDAAMLDALDGTNSFATVAMVKFGDKFAGADNDVQFFVYDANGDLANEAALDTFATNTSIPQNCTNCHGGVYDARTGVLTGASFLPFDPEGFLFARAPGFTYEDQEEALRIQNDLVKNAGAPPGTFQFVDGIYGGKSSVPGTKANLEWMPPGWAATAEGRTVYRELYKPYCRTCHTSQVGEFAFLNYEDFKSEATKSMQSACITNDMPVAEATMNLFWRSPARAFLLNSLDGANACRATGGDE